jgi:hypothetical protein
MFRTTWAPVANITRAMIALRLFNPLRTASPFQKPSWRFRMKLPSPAIRAATTARMTSATHHGMLSGPISVKERIAASATSITTIGSSAATRTEALGLSAGAVRRSVAIRTPSPKLLLNRLPRYPTPAAL